jgi:hypothetical protein
MRETKLNFAFFLLSFHPKRVMNINEKALSHYKNDDFLLEMVNGHQGNYIQHVYY